MEEDRESEIIHRELDSDGDDPAVAVVNAIAEIEGVETDELPMTYNCIDGMLTEMYSDPPSAEAQLQVTFTYAGYRVTVEQNGSAKFVQVE